MSCLILLINILLIYTSSSILVIYKISSTFKLTLRKSFLRFYYKEYKYKII